jgi:hypothetical protein
VVNAVAIQADLPKFAVVRKLVDESEKAVGKLNTADVVIKSVVD